MYQRYLKILPVDEILVDMEELRRKNAKHDQETKKWQDLVAKKNPDMKWEKVNVTPEIFKFRLFLSRICTAIESVELFANAEYITKDDLQSEIDEICSNHFVLEYEPDTFFDITMEIAIIALFKVLRQLDVGGEGKVKIELMQILEELTIMSFDCIEEIRPKNHVAYKKTDISSNEDYIDTSKIVSGDVISNYPELCERLNQPVLRSGSNTFKAQLKKFERYFKWEKHGRKFVILDIYDEPLTKKDGRKDGRNSIYIQFIETILLMYLSYQRDYRAYFTKTQLWRLLGMINENYKKISLDDLNKEFQTDHVEVSKFELGKFYQRSNQRLTPILMSALHNLDNRCLIRWESQTIIVIKSDEDGSKEEHVIADDIQRKWILRAEKQILNEMGMYSKNHVHCSFRENEYYKKLNSLLSEEHGWSYTYNRFKIIYNKPDVQNAVKQNEIRLARAMLNQKIVDALDKNAETVYQNQEIKSDLLYQEKIAKLNDEQEWGVALIPTKQELGIFQYPHYFVDIQKMINQKLIALDKHRKVIIEDDDCGKQELDQLFMNPSV